MKKKIVYLFLLALVFSCSKEKRIATIDNAPIHVDGSVVPIESALERLESFMNNIGESMSSTKSESPKGLLSVDNYYLNNKTKSDYTEPDAYIVNFKDYGGYAILGAHQDQVSVIALAENANIDPSTLEIILPPSNETIVGSIHPDPFYPADDELGTETVYRDTTVIAEEDLYSTADQDYYCGGEIGQFVSRTIINGIAYRESMPSEEIGDPEEPGSGSGSGSQSGIFVPNIPRLSILNWGQNGLYDDECGGKAVGCSVLAAAMIMAYNNFPDALNVNGTSINWASVSSCSSLYDDSPESLKTQVQKLIASIYWFCNRIYFWMSDQTMVTPKQIENRFRRYGYSNVTRLSSNSFTDSMLSSTVSMLQSGKPVFISAMKGMSGHSWMIEGCRSEDDGSIYCNWGWYGASNGYFTRHALEYNWHYRMITYDIPSIPTSVSVSY